MRRSLWKRCLRMCLLVMLICIGYAVLPSAAQEANAAAYGFRTTKGNTYFYDKNGKKHKGWLTYKGNKYYFDKKTGGQRKGWQYDGAKNKIRYFTKGKGVMVTGSLKDSRGNVRYFDTSTGLMKRGWRTDSGKKYYYTSGEGVMLKGWNTDTRGNVRFFSKNTGVLYTGYRKVGSYYYYFEGKYGIRYQKGFQTLAGKKYYFDPKTGRALKGWQTIHGKKYYFNSSYVMKTGLQKIGSYYYYFSKTHGYMYQKGFGKVGGKQYYFDKTTGRAQTGWLTEDGRKYYFDSQGVMYVSRTATIGGKSYTFDANGVAKENSYTLQGGNVRVYDSGNKKYYLMAKEYLSHPGIADGKLSDRDLLAAICDAEANDQGLYGMEAVAMCILNRTIKSDKEFPSTVREVVYQAIPSSTYPQYTPVRDGALLKRLKGSFEDRTNAYKAADAALNVFKAYVTKKTPRTIPGFEKNRKDFNFMYFMTPASFKKQPLNFKKVDSFTYKGHVFFVDWV